MKLNKYMIAGGLSILLTGNFSSCSLDYEPLDTYSDVTEGVQDESGNTQLFKDKTEVESALTALYELMKSRIEHWYLDLILISDAYADNAYGGTTDAQVRPIEDNSVDGSSSIMGRDWNRYLEDVAQANRIIIGVDQLSDTSFTDAERNSIKAQAKIFRSLIWFDMVRIWGNIPLITTVAPDITADNIEEVFDQYFPAQSTPEEVYKQIETDLLEALKDAPDNNDADKTRFSKSVARAILAKVYAEKPLRDYNKVIQYCDELAAEGFGLVDDFSDLFGMNEEMTDVKMRNTKESILEAQWTAAGGNWSCWMFGRNLLNWDENFTWAKWITPSRDLIKLYEEQGDTERYSESIVYYECTWSNYYPADHYPFMYKCRSGASSVIKLRYADILLLKAEACIMGENKNLSEAFTIINRIRERAGLAPLDDNLKSNENALLDAYLTERRMELAFEGQRWFDLCRLNKVEEVMNNLQDEGRRALAYPFTEESYLLPIPQTALDQNDKLVQNPGR